MNASLLLSAAALAAATVTRPAAAQAPSDSVRLTLTTAETVAGGFIERSDEVWRLSTAEGTPRVVPVPNVRRAERQVVRTRSQLRSKSMFAGMLIGAAAGVAVYATEIGNQSGDPGLAGMLVLPLAAGGGVYGAGIGWLVGSMRPLTVWRELR